MLDLCVRLVAGNEDRRSAIETKTPHKRRKPKFKRLYALRGLRRARMKRGLTQTALAARAGIARPTVVQLEYLEQRARTETVERLLHALGSTPDELLGRNTRSRERYENHTQDMEEEGGDD